MRRQVCDGGFGQAPGLRTARQLGFFDGGGDAAVLNYGGGRVAEHSADSEDVQLRLPAFFDFGPGVFQGYGSIEDRLARRRVGVDAEIAEPLELEALHRRGACPARVPVCSPSALRATAG